MKNLLTVDGMTDKDICEILNLADQLKFEKQHKISHSLSTSAVIGIYGEIMPLTAAAVEIAAYELGAHTVRLPDMSAEICSRLADCIVAGKTDGKAVEDFEKSSGVPVIYASEEESENPLEKLSTMMTVRENMGTLSCSSGEEINECDKAENILHVTKAVLVKTLKNG